MKTIQKKIMTVAVAVLLLSCSGVWATNIQFNRGPEIVSRDIPNNTVVVRFSLGWDNSWKLNSPPNHDAAWIFMKYRYLDSDGFRHANLHQVPHIVRGTDGFGAGSTPHNVEYGMSSRQNAGDVAVGVFLSRSQISIGTNVFENIELHWDISETNIDANTMVSVRIFAIEMVFIPAGSFSSPNVDPGTGRPVFSVGGAPVAVHPHWPKGTNPFYIMKHEVTQHAWVDFLNTLTVQQQTRLSHIPPTSPIYTRFRDAAGAPTNFAGVARMYIRLRQPADGGTPAVFGMNAQSGTPSGPNAWNHEVQGGNIPMFGLAWTDALAYLDWAGLRPITELEYEKAVTGEMPLLVGQFAWGTADLGTNIVGFTNPRMPNEIPGNEDANRTLPIVAGTAPGVTHTADIAGRWPIRAGAFAREATTRFQAGATFWGVLNMSDNVAERFVSFGFEAAAASLIGRNFTGAHGDGHLTADGLADVPCWPGRALPLSATSAGIAGTGSGYRGIGATAVNNLNTWATATASSRTNMGAAAANAANVNNRDPWTGMRGGRSVPITFSVMNHPSTASRSAVQIGHTAANQARRDATVLTAATAAFTHVLSVSAIGLEGAPLYQWFWTDNSDFDPEVDVGTPIVGATAQTFTPASDVAHGPRFFFVQITDQETNEVITSNLSGAHSVMGIATHPSTATITTSMTQGTNNLTVAPVGGVGPFSIEWRFVQHAATAAGETAAQNAIGVVNTVAHATAGVAIPQAGGVGAFTYRPVLPLPVHRYTFFAIIHDQGTGLNIRTAQSGWHVAPIINSAVWVGQGQGASVAGTQGQTGTIHTVTLQPGVYRLEAWGASGGRGATLTTGAANATSRFGGYAQTHVRFDATTTLFVVPGGAGGNAHGLAANSVVPGGFNGGGPGSVAPNLAGGGGGGGASHISLATGQISSQAVRDNIVLVAGGGGGGSNLAAAAQLGGSGGGTNGFNSGTAAATGGGTQLTGGTVSSNFGVVTSDPTPGAAGQGGSGLRAAAVAGGGGGGGWFGGGGGSRNGATAVIVGGGGGSSHVAPAFIHTAGALVPTMHASAPNMPPLAVSVGPNAAGTAIPQHTALTGISAATTPRHPSTLTVAEGGSATAVASTTNVLGGAVRIIRLQ